LRALWARGADLRARARESKSAGVRVSIVDRIVRMPPLFEPLGGQDGVALYRAAAAHAASHLAYSTQKFALGALRPVQLALAGLIEDARVEQLAIREMPGLARLWLPFHIAVPAPAATAAALMERLARALIDPDYEDDNAFVSKGRRMFGEASRRLADPSISREIGNLLGNDLGQMRMAFDLRTYVVEPPYRDDNLFLWDFGDGGAARSEERDAVYRAVNLSPDESGEPAEVELREIDTAALHSDKPEAEGLAAEDTAAIEQALGQPRFYDEWDYMIQADRRAWCTLFERPAPLGDARDVDEILRRNDETVQRLTGMIRAVQIQRPRRIKRQLEGDRLDLDACIAASVDVRSGRAPDPRVHQRPGRSSRDLAVLLLLDLSQSTNDHVASARTTVLDLARQATSLVAHAMDGLGDAFAIHGFDSNGRQEVEYYRFKDFDCRYDDLARARVAGMRGQLSTRMGCALRHAGGFLRERRAAHKLVLILTDGEPHDIDVHDRQYLVFDAKRAVDEQRRHGIATFCISLDPSADQYVSRIFGARNYTVLDMLRRLPEKLPVLYLRLTS
jgi:hypothetical protein